jgi:hypothetical protein
MDKINNLKDIDLFIASVSKDEKALREFLKLLIEMEKLDHGTSRGITEQVINKGIKSLSEKQKYVFANYVLQEFEPFCSRCQIFLPLGDMRAALTNGNLCNYCWNMAEKIKKD